METNPTPTAPVANTTPATCALKILGAGGAGVALMNQFRADLAASGDSLGCAPTEVVFAAVDAGACKSDAGIGSISIPKTLLGGHGAHRTEPGKTELEGQLNAVKPVCANCETIFIFAGLGGRAGSWLSSAVARAGRDAGAAVFAFVTLPFHCEGSVQFSRARQALERLEGLCDFVFCLPHEDAASQQDESTSLLDAYNASNQWLLATARHVASALRGTTIMGLRFADLCTMLRERKATAVFAVGESNAENRAGATCERLLAHPRLLGGKLLSEAELVGVSLTGARDMRVGDVNKVMKQLGEHWSGTQQLMSASLCDAASGPFSALLLVLTHEAMRTASRLSGTDSVAESEEAPEAAAFERHFLQPPSLAKAGSRAPAHSDDESAESSPRPRAARARRTSPRMRQAQLPLDVANKGRFEKIEPTIHKGEDLDVPTYLRRGIVLN